MERSPYQVGAHLKALNILVWILGPESTTATVLFRQSWLHCEKSIIVCKTNFQIYNGYNGFCFIRFALKPPGDRVLFVVEVPQERAIN